MNEHLQRELVNILEEVHDNSCVTFTQIGRIIELIEAIRVETPEIIDLIANSFIGAIIYAYAALPADIPTGSEVTSVLKSLH